MECDPVVLCGDLQDTQAQRAVCICDDSTIEKAPSNVSEISLISDGSCLSSGVVFGPDSMDPVTLLIVLLAVSTILGCSGFAFSLTQEKKHNSSRMFFMIESADAVMDVLSYLVAQGNGDLVFLNDDGVVSTALAISVWFSVVVFVLEVFAWCKRDQLDEEFTDFIPYLLCIHVITEDVFQTVVYIAVGTSHLTVPGAIWIGGIQALMFVVMKMYEMISPDEVGLGLLE